MGLALNEIDREARHRVLRGAVVFDFMSSTPTLFNSGTRSQLSSAT
jgi:ribonucleoside-diphosphate reductase alpha chain